MKRRSFLAATSALIISPIVTAKNRDWPAREIRLLHPFTAGDQTDVSARIIAAAMSERLGVSIVVQNKPGAGGVSALRELGSSKPDGHTIGYISNGNVSLDAIFQRYDLLNLIDPIARLADSAQTLYARSSKGYHSLSDMLEDIKRNPKKVSLGVGGLGAPSHVMWEMLATEFEPNLDVNLIPYKSATEATQAMLGGYIDAGVSFLTGVVPYIQKPGAIHVLAISSKERNPLVPQLPTISESIGKNFSFMNWNGLCAPKGTPPEVSRQLFDAAMYAVKSERYQKFCADYGVIINPSPNSAVFRSEIEAALKQERALAKAKNISQGGI